jgi:hypothetical protein
MVTSQNLIQEINRRLDSGNACNHSFQNLLSPCLLLKNIKSRIYKSIILPVLYGCETWYLILREEHRLMVFENRVLRRIFGPKSDGVRGGWIIRIIKFRRMRWVGHVAWNGEEEDHV